MTSRSTKEVRSAAASADLTVASFERRREVTVVMEIATGDCKSCYLVEHLHFEAQIFWPDIGPSETMNHLSLSQASGQAECVFRHLPVPGPDLRLL